MKGDTSIPGKSIRTKERIELHFFDEVYRRYVIFLIVPPEELLAFLRDAGMKQDRIDELGPETSSGQCIVLNSETCDISGQNATVIWLRERHVPCLVHELTHLTFMTFEDIDVAIHADNQEAFCFYVEHWVKRITELWHVPRQKPKQ